MSGIGLAYKLPEDRTASMLDAGARAVTQPPAQPGIGMATLPQSQGTLTAANNPAVLNDGGPEVVEPAAAAPPAPAAALAPAGEKPLIDWHENPLAAMGLVLSSVGAGLEGKESPVAQLRKDQIERQAMEYKQAALALDVVDKTSKFVSRLPAAQRKDAISDLDKRFSGALGGHSLAPFLTAATAGDAAQTEALIAALKQVAPSPAMLSYWSQNPDEGVKFLQKYNEHQVTKETPEEAAAKAGAVRVATNQADKDKPMTPAEIAANKISAANAATSAATLTETKAQHGFEREQAGNKPLTDAQANAAMFADRAHEAEAILSKHGKELAGVGNRALDSAGAAGRAMQGSNYQKAAQAKTNFLMAVLRKESGAAIGKDELATGDMQYFPQPGDKQAVINQKAANRATAMAGLSRAAGPKYQPPAPIIHYDAHGNRIPD